MKKSHKNVYKNIYLYSYVRSIQKSGESKIIDWCEE